MSKTIFSLLAAVAVRLTAFGAAGINEKEVFAYDAPDRSPIWFGGESRCTDVDATKGRYCIFIDIYYADGSHTWAKMAHFSRGTHGWERSEYLFLPPKPVKRINFYRMLRDTAGKAEFREAFLRREAPPEGYSFAHRRYSMRPWRVADRIERLVYRGGKIVTEFEEVASSVEFPGLPAAGTVEVCILL